MAIRGPRVAVVRVNTFGLVRGERYGLIRRTRPSTAVEALNRGADEVAVYNALRGAVIAARAAHAAGAEKDLKAALLRAQVHGVELVRRIRGGRRRGRRSIHLIQVTHDIEAWMLEDGTELGGAELEFPGLETPEG